MPLSLRDNDQTDTVRLNLLLPLERGVSHPGIPAEKPVARHQLWSASVPSISGLHQWTTWATYPRVSDCATRPAELGDASIVLEWSSTFRVTGVHPGIPDRATVTVADPIKHDPLAQSPLSMQQARSRNTLRTSPCYST